MSAAMYPQLAANPSYIYPATKTEHRLRQPGGNFANATHGAPLNVASKEEF